MQAISCLWALTGNLDVPGGNVFARSAFNAVAYALPGAAKASETLAKVPFKVCLGQFMNETAALCDLVLPTPMGLERWDDVDTPYGAGENLLAWSIPVVDEPVFDVKNGGDLIL